MALMVSNAVVVGDEDLRLAEGCVEPIGAADVVDSWLCVDALASALEAAISACALATATWSSGGAFALALALCLQLQATVWKEVQAWLRAWWP